MMKAASGYCASLWWGGFFAVFAFSPTCPLSAAEGLQYPLSIAIDKSGTLFLADRNLPGVWRLEGEKLSPVFKASKKMRTTLNAVWCVSIDRQGNLLAGDSATRDVYRFDAKGVPRPLTVQRDGLGQIEIPMGITSDAEGNLLVSDLGTHRVVKVPKEGGEIAQFAAVSAPRGLFFDSQKRLWVVSGRALVRFDPNGQRESVVRDGAFQFPNSVVVAEDGTAYVSDGWAKTIWKIPPGKEPERWASGPPFDNPVGMALYQGKLFVVDPRARAVFEIDANGRPTQREAKPSG